MNRNELKASIIESHNKAMRLAAPEKLFIAVGDLESGECAHTSIAIVVTDRKKVNSIKRVLKTWSKSFREYRKGNFKDDIIITTNNEATKAKIEQYIEELIAQ